MRQLVLLIGLAAAIACLLAWRGLQRDSLSELRQQYLVNLLVGERQGYVLTPPEFVAQPFIRRIEWSPDGKYAVLVQTVFRMEGEWQSPKYELRHRILGWSRATKRTQVLWESPRTDVDIDPQQDIQIGFFKGMPACVLVIRRLDQPPPGAAIQKFMVYHASFGGRVVELGEFLDASLLMPPEDTQGYLVYGAFLPNSPGIRYFYVPLLPIGKVGGAREFELKNSMPLISLSVPRWHADGKRLIIYVPPTPILGESPELVEINQPSYIAWNPRTNEEEALSPEQAREQTYQRPRALHTEQSAQAMQHKGARDTTQTTWLADGNRVALIAADSALAEVSPQGDAILYVAHGAAFYRALMRTSPQELSKAVEEARLEAYRTQARQIATALLMYVQDYDMCFPPAYGDEQVALVIQPYLKDPKLFEVDGVFAFRYLLNGESIAQMDSQVDTVVGYLQLPDGRMVIYADGHVKWEPQQ